MERLDPPLRIDWLDADDLRDVRPGRLGMTFLPGKRGPSVRYPGRVYRRELARDLASLHDAGTRYLLLLVEDAELERWGDLAIVERGAEAGIEIARRPLSDGGVPDSLAAMDEMLASLDRARESSDAVVACMGGVGRTGTVAACALVAAGWPAERAIARVRAVRHPTAVETPEQVAFVRDYEGHLAARRPPSASVAS